MFALAFSSIAALHWQYPQALPVVLPLTVALAASVLWAYAPQVRQAGRGWAWVLPGLRFAAFGVLTLSLLRPSVTRPRTAAERGPLVVLLDDSRSMAATDTGRPPGQRVAVAAALGRLPADVRDAGATAVEAGAEQLSTLADAVARARAEVGYARLAGRDADAATGRLDAAVDAVRRAARSTAALESDRTPALEHTLALLATAPAGVDREAWLDRLSDRARAAATEAADARVTADARLYDDDPAVHDAADAVAGETRGQLAWAAVFDPHAGLLARLGPAVPSVAYAIGDRVTPVTGSAPSPDGFASDLAGGVRVVLERLASAAAADAEPPRAVVLLSDGRQVSGEPPEAAAAGVPVYTVAIAARVPSPNVAVTDLVVPPAVYPGEPVTCRATVRATALVGAATDLTFTAGDERQARRVTFANDRPMPVAFTWTPRTAGPTPVSVRATPVPGEATDADNVVQRWTRVVGSPVRVTVLAPAEAWEFESACASLADARGVRLTAGLTSPAAVEQIARSDVVVLFDVTSRSLSPAQWDAVNRLVSERGGGVVLLAGEGGFGTAIPPTSVLARLLPFTAPPPPSSARPLVRPRPTGDADAPRLADEAADNARRWAALPSINGYLPPVPLRPDARALVMVDDPPVPLLTEQRLGPGRVMCLRTDQTWRWRLGGGQALDRFWTALVRTAAGEPYAVEQGGVALDADAFAVAPGQAVHLRLRANGDGLACRLRVFNGSGEEVRAMPFRPRQAGRYDATVAGLPAGDYAAEAEVGPARPRVPLHVHPSFDAELAEVSGDDGFLRRLSGATGGESLRLEQLDRLAARLGTAPVDPPRPVELTLWDSPYLYAAVLGLLTAEWALRRQAGLA